MKKLRKTCEGVGSQLKQHLVSGCGVGQSRAVIEPSAFKQRPAFSRASTVHPRRALKDIQWFPDFSHFFSEGALNAYIDLKLNCI